jgi:hypothetical protein
MSDQKPNIYQRLNKVMQAVAYVQKDASISGGGPSYKAVTHDQVVSVARSALVENGVMIYPVQLKGQIEIKRDVAAGLKMHLYSGTYEIHFVNVDNGEDRVTAVLEAHAADNGDKAPGKCITYATKAAILKVLCLETGENDESREDVREKFATINEGQLIELLGAIKLSGMTNEEFCAHSKVNIPSVGGLNAARFQGCLKWLAKNTAGEVK